MTKKQERAALINVATMLKQCVLFEYDNIDAINIETRFLDNACIWITAFSKDENSHAAIFIDDEETEDTLKARAEIARNVLQNKSFTLKDLSFLDNTI